MKKKSIFKTRPFCRFASSKTGKTQPAKSALIRDLLFLLEFDPNVITYTTEVSEKVYLPASGKYKPFRFDISIERASGKQFGFVQTPKRTIAASTISKIQSALRDENIDFKVFAESEIRRQPYLDNIKLLRKYSRQHILPAHQITVFSYFSTHRTVRLEDLKLYFSINNLNPTIIFTLLFRQQLLINLDKPLSPDALLRQNGGAL